MKSYKVSCVCVGESVASPGTYAFFSAVNWREFVGRAPHIAAPVAVGTGAQRF